MKRLALVTVFACVVAQAIPRYTAEACRAKGKVGEVVKLEVAYLNARRDGGKDVKEGYVFMEAYTYDGNQHGGSIEVAIPEAAVDYYVKRAGIKTRYRGHRYKVRTYEARGTIRTMEMEHRDGEVMYVELDLPKSLKKKRRKLGE
ncbi:MAG: hypothetical protein HN849_17420 [Victivallales bacterium]|jgi:hypothetical protein|nr:hypothetical protein [Victivallales bacterium]MBT7301306.1 hypothetical protein [Victivallales bacterium]